MDLLLDLLQAAGIGAAIGIRPALGMIVVALLAMANFGVDFDGTDYRFLEGLPLIAAAAVFGIGIAFAEARNQRDPDARGQLSVPLLLVSAGLGAIFGAAALAEHGSTSAAGFALGAVAAILGFTVTRKLFAGARRRLDAGSARTLPVYAEAAAGIAAALSVLLPPLSLLVLGTLVWLLVGSRRQRDGKYAGLRILR